MGELVCEDCLDLGEPHLVDERIEQDYPFGPAEADEVGVGVGGPLARVHDGDVSQVKPARSKTRSTAARNLPASTGSKSLNSGAITRG